MRRLCFLVAALLVAAPRVWAAQTNVAVAANFTDTAKELATAFKAQTGDDAVLSFGSSGALYTQITQSAPFDILLSADDERPKKAIKDGLGVPGSEFTYAVGKVVLWSKEPGLVKGESTLQSEDFNKLSICDPVAAPYGLAAVQTMKKLGLYDALKAKFVVGANISQAYQFVATGNAELGFVALSQIANDTTGSRWVVPQDLYTPIRQDAVLLKTGASNKAATEFMQFLASPKAKAIIAKYGYETNP